MSRASELLAERRASLEQLLSAKPWIPHTPTPKQQEFLDLECLEAFYGGAAGGGKSDAILMAGAQYVHVPGYAALILRRTYADLSLPGAIMDRAKEWWIPRGVDWNDKEKRFTWPSGATMTFGYLHTDRDRYRYASAEFQYIGFDELTQFPFAWYNFLRSRLRRLKNARIPLRIRGAGNPGGIGHDAVKAYFVENGSDPTRVFVPAKLDDNPHLDRESYRRTLDGLDPTTRAQLRDGLWVRDSSGLIYDHFSAARNVIQAAPEIENTILGIDYGFSDETAFAIVGWRPNDPTVYGLESFKEAGLIPSAAAEIVEALEAKYHHVKIVGDVGGLGKGYAEEARSRFRLPIEPAEKNNKRGYIKLLNGDMARGRVKVVAGTCGDLVTEWEGLPRDLDGSEVPGAPNHCADAFLYAWRACSAFLEAPKAPEPERGTNAWLEAEERRMEAAAEAELDDEEAPRVWWRGRR